MVKKFYPINGVKRGGLIVKLTSSKIPRFIDLAVLSKDHVVLLKILLVQECQVGFSILTKLSFGSPVGVKHFKVNLIDFLKTNYKFC